MKRRGVLAAIAGGIATGSAGLVAARSETTTTPEPVPPVTLDTEDYFADDTDDTVYTKYHARVQDELTVREETVESADDTKLLVVQLQLTNQGRDRVAVDREWYELRTPSRVVFPLEIDAHHSWLETTKLQPGATVTEWLVFEIGTDVQEATLGPNVDVAKPDDIEVEFEHDPDLAILAHEQ